MRSRGAGFIPDGAATQRRLCGLRYVITPRSRPTVPWSDRTQFGPAGTVRVPFPSGGASAPAPSGRHLPLLMFHGEAVRAAVEH
jgi:hypothetical protein